MNDIHTAKGSPLLLTDYPPFISKMGNHWNSSIHKTTVCTIMVETDETACDVPNPGLDDDPKIFWSLFSAG